jgi:hypothetical protein
MGLRMHMPHRAGPSGSAAHFRHGNTLQPRVKSHWPPIVDDPQLRVQHGDADYDNEQEPETVRRASSSAP